MCLSTNPQAGHQYTHTRITHTLGLCGTVGCTTGCCLQCCIACALHRRSECVHMREKKVSLGRHGARLLTTIDWNRSNVALSPLPAVAAATATPGSALTATGAGAAARANKASLWCMCGTVPCAMLCITMRCEASSSLSSSSEDTGAMCWLSSTSPSSSLDPVRSITLLRPWYRSRPVPVVGASEASTPAKASLNRCHEKTGMSASRCGGCRTGEHKCQVCQLLHASRQLTTAFNADILAV